MFDDENWKLLQSGYPQGTKVLGIVTYHHSFGIDLKIEGIDCQCIVEIIEFKETGRMTPEDFPALGTQVEAEVLGFTEISHICKLSMKRTYGLTDQST